MSIQNKYRAAIFDMDGTVLDTVQDLGDALNHALHEAGHTYTADYQDTVMLFGSGVKVAVQRALAAEAGYSAGQLLKIGTPDEQLPESVTPAEVEKIQNIYRPYYHTHNAIKTAEYPGISKLLAGLKERGVRTAVVSNKPHAAVVPLVATYFKDGFDFALGEQSCRRRKPAPDMVLYALQELEVSPEEAVYIGDTEIDLQTAGGMGMDCICVTWGFREEQYLQRCGARMIAHSAEEIYRMICIL